MSQSVTHRWRGNEYPEVVEWSLPKHFGFSILPAFKAQQHRSLHLSYAEAKRIWPIDPRVTSTRTTGRGSNNYCWTSWKAERAREKMSFAHTHTPGTRCKKSLWTILAVTKVAEEKPMFQCSFLDVVLSSNRAFSSSNVTIHYKAKHNNIHGMLIRLNSQNATEDMLRSDVQEARDGNNAQVSEASIKSFFRPTSESSRNPLNPYAYIASKAVPVKTLQAVALVLYSCVAEAPFSSVASCIHQNIDGGHNEASKRAYCTPEKHYLSIWYRK